MDIATALQYALDGNAILFTGSGFSYGATNINGKPFITGMGLRDYLAKECDILKTTSTLSAVANYHITYHKDTQPIIDSLTQLFTVKDVTEIHKTIMSIGWKRVYTTNYDGIAEIATVQNGNSLKPVTLSSECINPASQKVCVHINGHIDNLTAKTLLNEFKLSDTSYDSETLRGKPWFDFMEKDFLSAKAIFIVGFSLSSDIDISRILVMPTISSKIIFINKADMDPIDKNTLNKYAPLYEIGIDGFATKIVESKKIYVSSPLLETQFESFVFEYMLPSSPDTATFQELTHFYSLGKLSSSIFSQDRYQNFKYLAPRKALDLFLRELNSYKVFLATSTLGNGKTVFCNMVRYALRKIDINVYTYSKSLVDVEFEISEICKSNKQSIVIIDDYYKHMDILKIFNMFGYKNIRFLLTSRQSKLSINYRKLINTLHINEADIQPLYLYSLVDAEPQVLTETLYNNKLLPSKLSNQQLGDITNYFKNTCHNLISNIVLDLYDSSDIKKKLSELIETAMKEENNTIHDLCILALSSSVMNLSLSFSDMLSLLQINYLRLCYSDSPLLKELFIIKDDSIDITSSIISKSLLYTIIPPKDLMDILLKVVKESDKLYKHDTKYRELLKAILSHTNFEPIIKRKTDNISYIMNFYNKIRVCEFCYDNPFYWEQFATVCITAKDYPTAKQCLESAYSTADKISNFTPFQIATINGELLLEELLTKLLNVQVDSNNCINIIRRANDLFLKYYSHPENNHYHIFSCTQKYTTIFAKISASMTQSQLSIYIEIITDISKKMTDYQNSSETNIYPSIEKWHKKINSSIVDAKNLLK